MILLILSLSMLSMYEARQISLREYDDLEKISPELLLSEIDLVDTTNYPNIEKLVFLTPWNREGYELSTKYANKLHYVSPCWYSFETDAKG